MNKIIASLDVGNSKTSCVIAEFNEKENKITVKSASIKETKGFLNGKITNENNFVETVLKAVSDAERIYNKNIKELFVGISSNRNSSDIISTTLKQKNSFSDISALKALGDKIIKNYNSNQKEVLHLFKLSEIRDEYESKKTVENFFKINFFVLTNSREQVKEAERVLKHNNLSSTFVSTAYASALSTTNEIDRRSGVLVVDIGSELTDFCIINNNKLLFCNSINMAGRLITEYMSYILETDFATAEKIKVKNVKMLADVIEEDECIKFDIDNNTEEHFRLAQIRKMVINNMFKSKMEEIFENIFSILNEKKMLNNFKEIVLTGGSSNVHGLETFISEKFDVSVRRSTPLASNVDVSLNLDKNKVKNPIYSTAIGLVFFAVESYRQNKMLQGEEDKYQRGFFSFIGKSLKNLLIDLFIS